MTDELVKWLAGQIARDEQSARAMPHAIAGLLSCWSPARLIADCLSKRRIVQWCSEVIGDRNLSSYGEFGALRDEPDALAVTLAVETLRLMVAVYADRPGYRREWQVSEPLGS